MEIVKPFVKWAGGKTSLIPQITKYFPFELKNGKIEKYIEPFCWRRSCFNRHFTKI